LGFGSDDMHAVYGCVEVGRIDYNESPESRQEEFRWWWRHGVERASGLGSQANRRRSESSESGTR